MVTYTKLMSRLEDMAASKAGGSENASDRETAGVVTVGTSLSKNVSAHFPHVDIISIESLCQNPIVHIAVGVHEKKHILASRFPLLDLQRQMIYKDGSRAAIVSDAAEVSSVLVVYRLTTLLLAPLRCFGITWEICTDYSCRH